MKQLFLTIITLLSMVGVVSASPFLKWDASTGQVDGYRTYYGTTPGSYFADKDVGNVTQYDLNNFSLTEGETYFFIVRGYNTTGESSDSNEAEYTVPIVVINPPDNLIYTEQLISWIAPSGSFDGYKIYYEYNGESGSSEIDKSLLQVDTPAFVCGDTFTFYLVSILNGVESDPTETITAIIKPCAPTNVRIE